MSGGRSWDVLELECELAAVEQAELVKTLSANGSFTVFAPTNAFAKLKTAEPRRTPPSPRTRHC
jgi:hypothetical protein